jgi:hypothetical protein
MKHISKLLFYVLSVGILFSNVACDESKKENTEVIKEAIPEEESFDIQPYEWESLPQDIQNQISGAGCNYATVNNENAFYMVNGCVKINGIYELLEEKETYSPDYSKQVYENSRWVITIIIAPNKSNDITEKGTLTLRSKMKNGSTNVDVVRFCGT